MHFTSYDVLSVEKRKERIGGESWRLVLAIDAAGQETCRRWIWERWWPVKIPLVNVIIWHLKKEKKKSREEKIAAKNVNMDT